MATTAEKEAAEAALLARKPPMGAAMTVADKIEAAELLKAQANLLFKRQELRKAVTRYAQVFAYINGLAVEGDAMAQYAGQRSDMRATTAEGEQIRALQVACWSNMALCYVKLGTTTTAERAIDCCDKVLAIDPTHPKAQFRKAQALGQLKHFERALGLLTALATRDPQDAAIRSELARLRVAKKADDAAARASSGFQGLFAGKSEGLFS